MSLVNTTVSFNVTDVANNPINNSTIEFVLAGILYSSKTNSQGSVTFSVLLNTVTVVAVTTSALGYASVTSSLNIGSGTNQFSITLGIDPNVIYKTIDVLDISNNPISNAALSLNGTIIGRTDSNGQIIISTISGPINIKIKALGYILLSITDTFNTFTFPSKFILVSSTQIDLPITIYGLSGTAIQLVNSQGSSIDTFIIDNTGEATSNILVNPGPYSIVATLTGYQTKSININVSSTSTAFAVGPLIKALVAEPFKSIAGSVVSASVGTIAKNPKLTGSDQVTVSSVTGDPESELNYPSEWIYPNAGNGKYLTSSQARVYISKYFVDEVDTIYYAYQNNRIPVYGYSSADPNAFGQGKRLVQGQITLNFVSQGYLYVILNETKKLNAPSQSPTDLQYNALVNLYNTQATLQKQLASGGSQTLVSQLATVNQQIADSHNTLGPSSINKVKVLIANSTSAISNVNANKLNVPFDITINSVGGGRTTTRTLKNCLLTTNEQVFDQSDNVIKDVYGFVGVELI